MPHVASPPEKPRPTGRPYWFRSELRAVLRTQNIYAGLAHTPAISPLSWRGLGTCAMPKEALQIRAWTASRTRYEVSCGRMKRPTNIPAGASSQVYLSGERRSGSLRWCQQAVVACMGLGACTCEDPREPADVGHEHVPPPPRPALVGSGHVRVEVRPRAPSRGFFDRRGCGALRPPRTFRGWVERGCGCTCSCSHPSSASCSARPPRLCPAKTTTGTHRPSQLPSFDDFADLRFRRTLQPPSALSRLVFSDGLAWPESEMTPLYYSARKYAAVGDFRQANALFASLERKLARAQAADAAAGEYHLASTIGVAARPGMARLQAVVLARRAELEALASASPETTLEERRAAAAKEVRAAELISSGKSQPTRWSTAISPHAHVCGSACSVLPAHSLNPTPKTANLKPLTLDPKPYTSNPKN